MLFLQVFLVIENPGSGSPSAKLTSLGMWWTWWVPGLPTMTCRWLFSAGRVAKQMFWCPW